MHLVDRLIGVFSPRAMASRTQARMRAETFAQAAADMRRSFDAARGGRRTAGWLAGRTSANVELLDLPVLRDRCRDLVRNNPHARRIVEVLANQVVGQGITPRAATGNKRLDDNVNALWREFARRIDASGHSTFDGLTWQAVRAMLESGEALGRLRPRGARDGLPVPLQVQLLESGHLDDRKMGMPPSGNRVLHGVERDAIDRVAAYWLFRRHPGERPLAADREHPPSVSVPAAEVIHLFDRPRPGQVRGVPILAASALRLRDLDDYRHAEILRKKIAACLVGVVMDDADPTGEDAEEALGPAVRDADGKVVERVEPGAFYHARGRDLKFNQPADSPGYDAFIRAELQGAGVGTGVTYEQLSGDLSRVNYSSYRAGHIDMRRLVRRLQRQVVIPIWCEPIWEAFVAAAQAAGTLPANREIRVRWTPPAFESVDPFKDTRARILAVRAGFQSLPDALAEYGEVADDQFAEIAATNKKLDRLGIALDSDPRRTAQAGSGQQLDMFAPDDEGDGKPGGKSQSEMDRRQ